MAETISIQELKPGMVILEVIEQNGPVKIRKSGLVTSIEMVQGLAEMGVISVSIDPDQTVEVEEHQSLSQTQFVMNANAEQPKLDADSHLSEQFNRSLFLPSLQRVPSAWQYYSAKIAMGLVVVIGGYAIGWLGGSYPAWLPSQNVPEVVAMPPANAPADAVETPVMLAEEQVDTQEPEIVSVTEEMPAAEPATQEAINVPATTEITGEELVLGYVDPDNDVSDQIGTIQEVTEESESDNPISPELLAKFEKAMEDLERESAAPQDDALEQEYVDPYTDVSDIQRVDQLPARIMTRLPNMSFSAHMYATDPRDRWVKVNDQELGEGDWITDEVMISKIEPQHVILIFQGEQFSMRALTDW